MHWYGWLLLSHSVLAVACGCRSPVVFLREEARDGVGEEGRHRPLLTMTVFAAGGLKGGRCWRHNQPRWMRTAPHLSSLSSFPRSTAATGQRHRAAAARPPSVRLRANRTVQSMWTFLPRVRVLPSCSSILLSSCVCRARMIPLFLVQF
ncbi:hypothetical protein TcCL_Unassigned00429 [Trypanosoma cruzi]|nr:hypothetical protein TcCL_Unassigned00429 [Trypanosoma cruzi]